jgi:hypothetical protein
VKTKSELPRFPGADKRLLGTWKSDKRRTFAEWNWKKNTSPKKKAQLKSFFGNLEITYTRTKVVSVLRYRKWAQARRYAVLATDDTSVVIVRFGKAEVKDRQKYDLDNLKILEEVCSKPQLEHIHFDRKYFWVSLGNGRNREFFRKIRSSA